MASNAAVALCPPVVYQRIHHGGRRRPGRPLHFGNEKERCVSVVFGEYGLTLAHLCQHLEDVFFKAGRGRSPPHQLALHNVSCV